MMEMNLQRGIGSIVNICSVASKGGAPFILGYSCAKSALKTLTKNNAAELASKGIRVNGIDMGWCLAENENRL
jgi:NAD(P)-dependent dehydrogenase (short-subunit alcohol dehydrogenase family)